MSTRKASPEDVALLNPVQRAAYDIVIAEEEAGFPRGIGKALQAAGLKQSDWGNAQFRLRQLAERRREKKMERIIDKPHPEAIRPGDPITLTPEERAARREVHNEIKAEARNHKLLKRAIDPDSGRETTTVGVAVVRPTPRSGASAEDDVRPEHVPEEVRPSQMASPLREDCALVNVLTALRRIPVENRMAVLEAARHMLSIDV